MYKAINLKQLLRFNETPCDLHIKLNEDKFLKFIQADSVYSEEIILKKLNQGVKLFYVLEDDYGKWDKFLSERVKLDLEFSKNLGDDAQFNTFSRAFAKVHDTANKLGINEETIEIVEGIQKNAIRYFRKNKKALDVLSKAQRGKNSLSEHSLIISHIACSVALSMSWSTESTLQKFIVASLFHDISLSSNKLIHIHTLAEAEEKGLTSAEIKQIRTHPLVSVELFNSLDINCPNADQIIMSHHELPDGSGFPKGIDAFNTPPYVCLFILAEYFIHTMHYYDFNDDGWAHTKEQFTTYFNKGNYKNPVKGFQKLFKQLA